MEDAKKLSVLMLHGFLGSPQNWRSCSEAVSPFAEVFTPDLELFRGEPETRLAEVMQFLTDLVETGEGRRWVLIGNSLGGTLAVHLALRAPERVAGLVLAGSGGLYEFAPGRQLLCHPDREWLRKSVGELFFDTSLVSEDTITELLAITRDRVRLRHILRFARMMGKMDVRHLLPRVHCPTLLVWGANDRVTPPATAENFKSLLPNAELHLLARCGHVPMMDRPAEFNRLVAAFLRRLAACAPEERGAHLSELANAGNSRHAQRR